MGLDSKSATYNCLSFFDPSNLLGELPKVLNYEFMNFLFIIEL